MDYLTDEERATLAEAERIKLKHKIALEAAQRVRERELLRKQQQMLYNQLSFTYNNHVAKNGLFAENRKLVLKAKVTRHSMDWSNRNSEKFLYIQCEGYQFEDLELDIGLGQRLKLTIEILPPERTGNEYE